MIRTGTARAASLLLVLLSGCLDVETKTVVHSDGSIVRTVSFTGDSASVFTDRLPMDVDDTWKISTRKIDDKKFVRTASRLFTNARDLDKAVSGTKGNSIQIRVSLEQSFRWFFTEYTYREKYLTVHQFTTVPIHNYVSESEIESGIQHEIKKEPFKTRGDSLALEDAGQRFEEWRARSVFEEYFAALMEGARRIGKASLPPDTLAAHKEQLFSIAEAKIEANNLDTLGSMFASVLRSSAVTEAIKANMQVFEDLKERLRFEQSLMSNGYKASVEMPGLITDTNAGTVEGSTAIWQDFITFAYIRDYEMWVTSRAVNWWMVIITGIFIVLGIALYGLKFLVNRTRLHDIK